MSKVIRDQSWKVSTYSHIHKRGGNLFPYMEGHIVTPLGIVLIGIYPATKRLEGYTHFETVINGRMYRRSIDRVYTTRGATRLAAKWIRELVDELKKED